MRAVMRGRLDVVSLTLIVLVTLGLTGCGGSGPRQPASKRAANCVHAGQDARFCGHRAQMYCQGQAAAEQRSSGCPEIVPSTTCKYTRAGIKLCGEDALSYCQQSSEKAADGCGPILEAVARSAGKPQEARSLEEVESYAQCAQAEGDEQCRRERADIPETHSHELDQGQPRVALFLRTSARAYVCLIGDNGRKLIPGVELRPGDTTPTYHARRFTLTLGNSAVTMVVNGKAMSVPSSSQAVGYLVTQGGGRQSLSTGQLPTCQ
jgi:hypothetical protein